MRLTGAPTRRLKVSIPHFFSPLGAPVVVPEGWSEETPGTIGTRAPTGAGAAPSPRDPGGLEHAPSGEGMGEVYQKTFLLSKGNLQLFSLSPQSKARRGLR